eukprot:32871_3
MLGFTQCVLVYGLSFGHIICTQVWTLILELTLLLLLLLLQSLRELKYSVGQLCGVVLFIKHQCFLQSVSFSSLLV